MAKPRFMRRRLHGNRQKLFVVTLKVAFEQCDHVTGGAHIRQSVSCGTMISEVNCTPGPFNSCPSYASFAAVRSASVSVGRATEGYCATRLGISRPRCRQTGT